jgi:DNA gyrase inhibitor GyrI
VKESTIRLSPNPAHNEITVSLSPPWKAGDQLIVCDAAGKPVVNRTINRNTEVLHITKLPAGNYFIKVLNSKAEQETLQFIKK